VRRPSFLFWLAISVISWSVFRCGFHWALGRPYDALMGAFSALLWGNVARLELEATES
jgi:hypothetical protein